MKKLITFIFAVVLFTACGPDTKTYKVVPYACAPNSTCLSYFTNNGGQITFYIEDLDTKEITNLTVNQSLIRQVLCDSVIPYVKVVTTTSFDESSSYYVWYSKNENSPFGPIWDVAKPTVDTTNYPNTLKK